MTSPQELRSAIIGLLGFAAAEEQVLLTASPPDESGNAGDWAAVPIVAHNTEFRAQQVERLRAIASGRAPEDYAEIDHASDPLYQGYAAQPAALVARDSWRVAGELIDGVESVSTDDLLDPSRNPWLAGRQLWLQIVVRGFWHPTGHLADYLIAHGHPDRAVAMTAHGLATARYLRVPDQACGMAGYNLACALAKAGRLDDAAAAVRDAVSLNPDLRGKAGGEPDLAILRETGRLDGVLA
jgi:hypothetical protein